MLANFHNIVWFDDESILDNDFIEGVTGSDFYIKHKAETDGYLVVTQENGYVIVSVNLDNEQEVVDYLESLKTENLHMFLGEALMNM